MRWKTVRINCLEWKMPDTQDEYYEYRTTAKQGWERLVVVEKGLKCWWWSVFDGNFFPYKIGSCAEREDAFNEATGHLTVLEARDHLPEEATTVLAKGANGEWHFEGKPAHQVVMSKFLEGLKPGVLLRVIPAKDEVPLRCQATSEAGAQCLLMDGHQEDHEFRDDTAAVWAEGEDG